jgi:hypothetical protein
LKEKIDKKGLYLPWSEKKKEIKKVSGDERLIAEAWNLSEDEMFYYIMLIATY